MTRNQYPRRPPRDVGNADLVFLSSDELGHIVKMTAFDLLSYLIAHPDYLSNPARSEFSHAIHARYVKLCEERVADAERIERMDAEGSDA